MCQPGLTRGNLHRNNFIVGQVTPDMLAAMPYGTYILFGILTYLGAAFIWFFVPETKRLTLEEMVRTSWTPSLSPLPTPPPSEWSHMAGNVGRFGLTRAS